MSNQEVELTAYCGLYCGDCIRYKSKFAKSARDLANELRNVKFEKYAEVKSLSLKDLEHYQEFFEVLDLMAKLQCDTPCRAGGDGCLQSCEIKKCVQLKNLQGCWECDEFEGCVKFAFLKPMHGDTPRKNLSRIKKYGLHRWVTHREKFYVWL